MADKKIKVKIDVETDVEPSIAQLKALKKQLRDTAAGSEEFAKLQQQINDTEDAIKSAKTGASNFTEVLGQLPGPIGEIGNKVSGAVNTLKQFSGLKITDIKASFVELGKDLIDVVKGFGQLTGITKAYTTVNNFLAASFVKLGIAEGAAAVGAKALSAALISTGIGALVVLLGTVVSSLMDYFDSSKKAEKAADDFSDAIKRQNELLAANLGQIDFENKKKLLQAKIANKSQEELNQIEADGLQQRYNTIKSANSTALQEQKNLANKQGKYAKISDEERAKLLEKNLENLTKLGKDESDAREAIALNGLEKEVAINDKKNQALASSNSASSSKNAADRKRDLEELQKGIEEARLNSLSAQKKEEGAVNEKYNKLKALAERYGKDTKVIEEARQKELTDINAKYSKEELEKKQKEYEDTLALQEQQLNLRVAKGEITETEYQGKLFELRKNNAVQVELLTNDTLKKEQDTLNNKRIADLSNLQLALQNEESTLKDSLDNKNAILLNDLQNGVINQEQFDTKKLEVQIEYQTNLDKLNLDSLNKKAQIDVEYKTNLDTTNAEALVNNTNFINAQIDLEKYKVEKKKELAEEERGILATRLQSQIEALDAENARIEGDFEQDLERLAEKRELLAEQETNELTNSDLTEFQKTEIKKKYADERKNITNQEIETEKAAMQAKHDINMAYLGLFEQFGNLLGQLAGKNKAIAIAGIVISQAAAIGQIIAQTSIANAKAVAANPLAFGQPWVTINTISAGLSIASTIASAAKSIAQINSQPGGSSGASGATGGGGAAAAMPTAPRVAGTAAPEIQTTGGQNPNTQLAETLNKTQAPLKAYVVSGDVSSQQALDRRTSRAATFSGG